MKFLITFECNGNSIQNGEVNANELDDLLIYHWTSTLAFNSLNEFLSYFFDCDFFMHCLWQGNKIVIKIAILTHLLHRGMFLI